MAWEALASYVYPSGLKTSKMRFTNNRLTGLQTDKTWLGSSRISWIQQNYKCTWLMVIAPICLTGRNFAQKSETQKV